MEGSKIDSVFTNFDLPVEDVRYRPPVDDKDNDLRIVMGGGSLGIIPDATYGSKNMFVTSGGALAKRPPFKNNFVWSGSTIASKRIDEYWYYESLPDTNGNIHSHILMSVYNPATGLWEMYYRGITDSIGVTQFTNLRNVNDSRCQHQVVVLRGLAYIKGAPTVASGELLGTIIFDGSAVTGIPVFRPWGLLGPTTPARVVGWCGRLEIAETAGDATWSVIALSAPPTTPFVLQCEYEMVNCTNAVGTGPYTLTVSRGYAGTTAVAHLPNTTVLYRNWSASTHKVNVKFGWEYSYCYKSITGQYSNRADIEYNPDMLPSNTGPFPDLIPKITVQGHADTTNIPSIVIFRTTDGGGNFAELETITNTGSGSITYEDKSLGTGASSTTKNDPIPDTKLLLALPAPSLTSNSPPPTINPPGVVGVNNPRVSFSKMVAFASRIWFFIDNVLYFSGDDEVRAGIPEECFMSGVGGNFFRFADRGIALEATSSALYILGSRFTYILNGSNKETFDVNQISAETPMSVYNPSASVSFLGRVAFITSDGRLCVITDTYIDTLSECIRSPAYLPEGIRLVFYANQNNQWLMVHNPVGGSGDTSYTYIYDWARSVANRKDMWFPVWIGKLQALRVMFVLGGSAKLTGASYDSVASATRNSQIVTMGSPDDEAANTGDDYIANGVDAKYIPTWGVKIHPFKNPPGNHINTHAVPHTTTTAHYIKLDYLAQDANGQNDYTSNIGMRIFHDALSYGGSTGVDITAVQTAPTRRRQSVGYMTKEWHLYDVGQDFGLFISAGAISTQGHVRLERLAFGVVPAAGPDSSGEKDA